MEQDRVISTALSLTKTLLCIGFILLIIFTINKRFNEYQKNKGIAVSRYLYKHIGVLIPPEEAQYLSVNISQYNLEVAQVEMFVSEVKDQYDDIKE